MTTVTARQAELARRLLLCDERMAGVGPFPTFSPDLPEDVRRDFEARLGDVAAGIPEKHVVRVNKFDLGAVLRCEGLWLGDQEQEFSWTARKALGTVLHRALAATVTTRGASTAPIDLVESIIESLARDEEDRTGLSEFLRSCPGPELAELTTSAAERLTRFRTDWPPIRGWMIPRVEPKLVVPLAGGRVVLVGKPDLAVGQPGVAPSQVLIVEFKSGSPFPEHLDEVRLYALLETLRNGVPPYRVAIYYLESGTVLDEEVSEDSLHSSARMAAEAVRRLCDMWFRVRPPNLTPGFHCRLCHRLSDCEVGSVWLATNARQETSR
jgi:hypothetical protein